MNSKRKAKRLFKKVTEYAKRSNMVVPPLSYQLASEYPFDLYEFKNALDKLKIFTGELGLSENARKAAEYAQSHAVNLNDAIIELFMKQQTKEFHSEKRKEELIKFSAYTGMNEQESKRTLESCKCAWNSIINFYAAT